MTSIYIAGPMRGIPEFNFPAFLSAGRELHAAGYTEVYNPAANDLKNGFRPWGMAGTEEELQDIGFSMADAMKWDLEHVLKADVIVMLPGWQHSSGAQHERTTAKLAGKDVWYWSQDGLGDWLYTEDPELRAEAYDVARANTNEVRVTNEVTGGQKGTKPERMDLVPSEAWEELGRVYGFGAQKYASHNWRKGYDWSLSVAALMRHVAAFNRGEDMDPESGLHHLAHAMFHCCSLIVFGAEHPELDDRYEGPPTWADGPLTAYRNPHDPQEWNDPDVVWDVDPDLDIDITDADLDIDWSGPLTEDWSVAPISDQSFDYQEWITNRLNANLKNALDDLIPPVRDPIDRDILDRDLAWDDATEHTHTSWNELRAQEYHRRNQDLGEWLDENRPVTQQKIERVFLERSDIHPPITIEDET